MSQLEQHRDMDQFEDVPVFEPYVIARPRHDDPHDRDLVDQILDDRWNVEAPGACSWHRFRFTRRERSRKEDKTVKHIHEEQR